MNTRIDITGSATRSSVAIAGAVGGEVGIFVTYGKNTAGSNQCYGYYNSARAGWGPAYQYNCIHSGTIASLGDLPTNWYNYAAATAGTIVDKDTTSANPATNTDPATESICPKGWTLPTETQTRTLTNGSSGSSVYVPSFSPVSGGFYNSGTLGNEDSGYWWGSEAQNGAARRYLSYNNIVLQYHTTASRRNGYYIRCIQAS